MRIACVIHSLVGGGAETLMAGLVNRLAANHDVSLITWSAAETDPVAIPPTVERVGLDLLRESHGIFQAVRNNLGRIKSLASTIRSLEPDVVLSFCDQVNVATLIALRQTTIPVVVAEMSDPRFHPMPRLWQPLRSHYYPQASAAVAISRASLPKVTELFGRPATLIPPAVETPPKELILKRSEEQWREPTEKCIVTLGRLSTEKRHAWLIEAFDQIAPQFPNWTLEIAGDGPLRSSTESFIHSLQSRSKISLAGRVPNAWDFLVRGAIFCSSSAYEGTPVSVLEAMKLGLPVVAIDSDSGTNDVVKHGQSGYLAENSIDALAQRLADLMAAPEHRAKFSLEAKRIADEYTWERFTCAYEHLFEKCIAQAN